MSELSTDNITVRQIREMKHAIGFSPKRATGTKHRKYKAYRNYFTTTGIDKSWDELVSLGLATSRNFPNGVGDNPMCYHVSEKGFKLLESLLGFEKIEEKD